MASNAGDDIIQNIILAGQDDVINGLNSIGQAGKRAFDDISQAASTQSLAGFAVGITGIAAAVGILAFGMFEFVQGAATSTITMANFAHETGTTTENMTTMISALTNAGNTTENLTVAFRRLAVAVESVWPEIQKSVRNAANVAKADILGVEQASLNLEKSQTALRSAIVSQQNLAANAYLKTANAALNTALAKDALNIALGGEHDKTLDVVAAQQRLEEAERAELEQAKQAKLAKIEAAEKVKQARLDETRAALNQSVAENKLAEDQANSIANLKQFIDNLAAGVSNAGTKINLSSENIIKGLVASVGAGINGIGELTQSIGQFSLSAPALFPVLEKVADIFQHTTDATLKAALATTLLGRGYSFTLVEALSKGSAALRELRDELTKEFDLTKERLDAQEQTSRNFITTFQTLGTSVRIVGEQFALLFAPIFTTVMGIFDQQVKSLRLSFLAWGESIRDGVTPFLVGLLSFLTGFNFSESFKLSPEQIISAQEWKAKLEQIKTFISEWVTSIKDFFTTVLPQAFAVVQGGLKLLSDGIHEITGIKIDPNALGLGLLASQLLGINTIVLNLGLLFVGLALIIGSSLGGLILLAGLALGAFIGWNLEPWVEKVRNAYNEIKRILSETFSFTGISDNLELAFAAILAGGTIILALGALVGWPLTIAVAFGALVGLIAQNWDAIKTGFFELIDAMTDKVTSWVEAAIAKITALKDALVGLFTNKSTPDNPNTTPSTGNPAGDSPGFAEGGLFRGRPGRDTNLAWLTDLEFIINPRATKFWGAGFLHAINQMQMPKFLNGGQNLGASTSATYNNIRNMLSSFMIPGFADGGLNLAMPSLAPSLAGGNLLAPPSASPSTQSDRVGGRSVTLVLNDKSFGPLVGSARVVDELEQHAALDQMTSTGYQPRWRK